MRKSIERVELVHDFVKPSLCSWDGRIDLADRKPGPIVEALCWSHARRKFFELADFQCGVLVSLGLDQYIEDLAFGVNRPPEVDHAASENRLRVGIARISTVMIALHCPPTIGHWHYHRGRIFSAVTLETRHAAHSIPRAKPISSHRTY